MMKNKLLTSIMAALLVLVASVSALTVSVDPTTVSMAEDTPLADAVELTVTLEEGEDIVSVECEEEEEGDNLTVSAVVDAEDETLYNLGITPKANWNGETSFSCIVTYTDSENTEFTEETEEIDVTVEAANDAPTITSTAVTIAVEDNVYAYDVDATDIDLPAQTLTYSLTTWPDGMTIDSATGLISWTPESDQLGSRDVVVSVADNGTPAKNTTQSFSIEVRPKKVCKFGELDDNLELTVSNPDDNEEYKAGDEMDIEVQVENDGDENLDVTVKVMLYDLDEGELLATVTSDETRVKDGEEENFDLTLTIPATDFDVDNDFMLYVTAYEDDDENCDFEAIPIELTRDDDDVIVSEAELTPEEVAPGKTVTATITVENIGEDDQDNVYIKLRNSYLDLNQETASFDLDDYKSDDNEYTATVTFTVPEDAEAKEYWVEAIVYFDGGKETDSELAKLVVAGKSVPKAAETEEVSSLEAVTEEDVSVEAGKKVAVPVVISNTGNAKASFTVEVSNVDGWAEVVAIEQPEQLNAGESGHAYIYLDVAEDAAIGVHELSLNIRNQDGLLATKKVAVEVEGITAEQAPADETNKITGLFTAGSSTANVFYVTGAVVLALIGLFFLRMLFKK